MVTSTVIGREKETAIINDIIASRKAELVAVYGRRRVGKTYLLKTLLASNFTFYATGLAKATTKQQISSFTAFINEYFNTQHIPSETWLDTFEILKKELKKNKNKKQIIFIDELPWLDTKRSDFLVAFELFWNAWGSTQPNLKLFVCGSAASWMINKLLKNKGGLHNRVTARIKLEPFTLKETEAFLKHKNIHLDRYQIIQLYMAIGGIPFYLENIKQGLSAAQNIQQLCFEKNGLLKDEFNFIFDSLFEKGKTHEAILRIMHSLGGTSNREDIIAKIGLASGGEVTKKLKELEESGFIKTYKKYGIKNTKLTYCITDFYTLFYLRFIEQSSPKAKVNWIKSYDTPAVKSWSGFAYEQICMQHEQAIANALQISGIQYETSTWRKQGSNNKVGSQIDLVIDRSDKVINLCEIKFSDSSYEITKAYDLQLRNKAALFKADLKTKRTIFTTIITTFGLTNNAYRKSAIQNELTMDALF